MRSIPLILIILLVLVVPATAANITLTAEPLGGTSNVVPGHINSLTVDVSKLQRDAIQRIAFDIPTGTEIDYTIWYGEGSSYSGHMIYQPNPGACGVGIPCQFSEVSIGTSISNHSYVGLQEIGRFDIIGYGRDNTVTTAPINVFVIYDGTAGISNVGTLGSLTSGIIASDAIAYMPRGNGVIYKFSFTSTKPVTGVTYYTNTQANVAKAADTTILDAIDEFFQLLNKIKDTVIAVFWFGYYVAEFIWDNIYLVIALYFGLTGVIALQSTGGNIFRALQKWFQYQRSLWNFFIGMWDTLINIITKIIK